MAVMLGTALAGTSMATALTVASAGMQIIGGMQANKHYKGQAEYKKLEGRSEAVKAKRQGIEVMRNMRQALSSVNAVAYAGGISPEMGSVKQFASSQILRPGYDDVLTARNNEEMIKLSAQSQARDLQFAGKQAMMQGFIGSFNTLGKYGQFQSQLGSVPTGSATYG
tara:strand:- start:9376 stop:9876 length:501 start_codon:yes stop_codon:yes gene_type:complete